MKIWRMLEEMHNKPYKFEPLTEELLQSVEQRLVPILESIAGIKSKLKGAGTVGVFLCLLEAKAPEEVVRVLNDVEKITLKGGTLYPSNSWLQFYVIHQDFVRSSELFGLIDPQELIRVHKSNGVDGVQAHVFHFLQQALSGSIEDLQKQLKAHTGALKGLSIAQTTVQ